ncbi:MAG: hypothetical protein R2856_06115 [Caldilineaceae bacterium]
MTLKKGAGYNGDIELSDNDWGAGDWGSETGDWVEKVGGGLGNGVVAMMKMMG